MREIDAITRFVTDTPLFVTAEIISPLLLKAAVRAFMRKADCCNAICRGRPACDLLFIFDKLCATLNIRSLLPDVAAPQPELNV